MKISTQKIEQIVELLKLRANWRTIADAVGVDPATLRNWRVKGYKEFEDGLPQAQMSIYGQFFLAIRKANLERYEAVAKTVIDAATKGETTLIKRKTRHPDGSVTESIETKISPPDKNLAHKILQLEDVDSWADVKHHKVDWRQDIRDQGGDPEEIKQALKDVLENGQQDDTESENIDEREQTQTEHIQDAVQSLERDRT